MITKKICKLIVTLQTYTLMLVMLSVILTLFACAGSGETQPTEDKTASPPAEQSTPPTETQAAAPTETMANTTSTASSSAPAVAAAEPMAPRMVDSCKDEAYVKYEQQARESIKKGLEATKAERFGVGFRDVAEHNKWSEIHNELFKSVAAACETLSQCTKKHAKDKDTECVNEAKLFGNWQSLAKSYTEQVKSVETTQPPKICSIKPSDSDPSRCFAALGDNIDAACTTEQCQDTSACWRSVGFLDIAINQAESSCGFVHQKLENCRAYTEATMRRKSKFKKCAEMHDRLNVTLMPVL